MLSPPPAFVLSQDQTLRQELPICIGIVLESPWASGGITPKTQFLTYCFFVCEMDWNPSRIDRQYRRPKSPYCPHCCSVFSSVFKELMLSACTSRGSDTDPQQHACALEGRIAMLTAVKTHFQHGFPRNPEASTSVDNRPFQASVST